MKDKTYANEKVNPNKVYINQEWVVSYKQLGLIIFTFMLGVITTLLLSTTLGSSSTSTFSPTDLINFVLSIILSSTSIVLAIVAISLGKASEKTIMDRNDESIKLQNEVFIKTTDALQRIQSSTGVTEKRIEDIISGRVGDMSQTLAEELSSQKQSGVNKKELESEIRESLMNSILLNERNDRTQKRREEIIRKRRIEIDKQKKYEKLHTDILRNIINERNFKIIKPPSHGNIDAEGIGKYDCVIKENKIKIGISTFREDTTSEVLNLAITSTIENIDSEIINKYIIILFNSSVPSEVTKTVSSLIDKYKNNIYLKSYSENSSAKEIVDNIL